MAIDLTTTIQAMPYVQNVAHAELVHPEAQLASAQLLAQQTLAEQFKQTQPIEQQDKMETVSDERQRQKQEQFQQRRRRRQPAVDEETSPANPTPFAGHIIDKKI